MDLIHVLVMAIYAQRTTDVNPEYAKEIKKFAIHHLNVTLQLEQPALQESANIQPSQILLDPLLLVLEIQIHAQRMIDAKQEYAKEIKKFAIHHLNVTLQLEQLALQESANTQPSQILLDPLLLVPEIQIHAQRTIDAKQEYAKEIK